MESERIGRAVVVGVDGSRSAEQAVRWATLEAARRKAPLRLVTAHTVALGVRGLADLAAGDTESVGGKAANLGELVRAGFPVPPDFVLPAAPRESGTELRQEDHR